MLRENLHPARRTNAKLLRRAVSGILTAIATVSMTAIHEIVFTNPSWVYSNRAVAQEDIAAQVDEKASPAVVLIATENGFGSGIILRPDGLILTNSHVVEDVRTATVTLKDGKSLPADVVAFDKDGLDLALLRIRQSHLTTIPLGNLDLVQRGQPAFAIGYPLIEQKNRLLRQQSISAGIVSRIDPERVWIEVDLRINPGNSGGPLLNRQAELVGVNTLTHYPSQEPAPGLNFAISVDRVRSFLADYDAGRTSPTPVGQLACTGKHQPQQLVLNSLAINGRLSSGDNVLNQDRSFCDLYTFVGKAGQIVRIDIVSLEFDPYLLLLDPNGVQIASARGSIDPYAEIVRELPSDGTYRAIANSHKPGESGTYNLRAESLILWRRGKLRSGESREINFKGQAGQSVTIILESRGIDTKLSLFAPDARRIGTSEERISQKLPVTGMYMIAVSASNDESDDAGEGQYTLIVREG